MRHSIAVVLCGVLLSDAVAGQGANNAPLAPPTLNELVRQNRAARLVDYDGWTAYRRHQSVFTFDRILFIFANQRQTERKIRMLEIGREEKALWRDFLTSVYLEAEAINLAADVVEVRRAYDELHARFQRLIEGSRGGAGIFGAIGALALNIAFSGIGGPVLGAAIAAGFTTAANGGNLLETVIAMGVAAGGVSVSGEVSGAVAQAATAAGQVNILANAAGSLANFGLDQAGQAVGSAAAHDQPVLRQVSHLQPRRNLIVLGPDDDNADSGRVLEATVEGVGSTWATPPLVRRELWTDLVRGGDTDVAEPVSAAEAAVQSTAMAGLVRAVRMRRVADPRQPVLTGQLLIAIDAEVRGVRTQVRYREVYENLHRRWERELGHIQLEEEVNHWWNSRAEWIESYNELSADYNRAVEKLQSGGGLLGALGSLIVGVIGTALGGPLVGAALAGAVGTAITGGTVGDVLFAAGFSAGTAYAMRVALGDGEVETNSEEELGTGGAGDRAHASESPLPSEVKPSDGSGEAPQRGHGGALRTATPSEPSQISEQDVKAAPHGGVRRPATPQTAPSDDLPFLDDLPRPSLLELSLMPVADGSVIKPAPGPSTMNPNDLAFINDPPIQPSLLSPIDLVVGGGLVLSQISKAAILKVMMVLNLTEASVPVNIIMQRVPLAAPVVRHIQNNAKIARDMQHLLRRPPQVMTGPRPR